ncbi:transglycosylase domain-containing protein [Streptomyces sp. M19]
MEHEQGRDSPGYLNTAYYGRGAYGIQAAARAYYDKDCSDLTPSEGAFLAATLNGPNLYDPPVASGPPPVRRRTRSGPRALGVDPQARGRDQEHVQGRVHEVDRQGLPRRQGPEGRDEQGRADRLPHPTRRQLRRREQQHQQGGAGQGRLPDPHHLRPHQDQAARNRGHEGDEGEHRPEEASRQGQVRAVRRRFRGTEDRRHPRHLRR